VFRCYAVNCPKLKNDDSGTNVSLAMKVPEYSVINPHLELILECSATVSSFVLRVVLLW
jgi:hypothetical protein